MKWEWASQISRILNDRPIRKFFNDALEMIRMKTARGIEYTVYETMKVKVAEAVSRSLSNVL